VQAHRRNALQIAEKVQKKILSKSALFSKNAKFERKIQTYYKSYKKHSNSITFASDAHYGGMIFLIVNVVPPGAEDSTLQPQQDFPNLAVKHH
jgi:hypothetical protein